MVREPGLTLGDALEELRFPLLLKAPGAALRPERVAIGLVLLLWGAISASVGEAFGMLLPGSGGSLMSECFEQGRLIASGFWQDLASLSPALVTDRVRLIFLGAPIQIFGASPIGATVFVLLLLPGIGVCGGAIARSSAEELGTRVRRGLVSSLWLGVSRARHAVLGLLVGPVVAAVLAVPSSLLVAAAFGVGGEGLGIALYGVALLLAIPAVAVLAVSVGASVIIPSATVCEGSDGFDASQRALAYVAGRPLYASFLLLLATGLGLGVVWLLWVGARLADAFVRSVVGGLSESARMVFDGEASGRGMALVDAWMIVPGLVIAAYGLSYLFTAGSAVYLVLREAIDGESRASLWRPGTIGGTRDG